MRLGLRPFLTAAVLATVLSTAALIHLAWSHIAHQNVEAVAGRLSEEIANSIRYEIATVIANATAAREALRTIFFQGVIETGDEAKREFVFLSLLRSQPSLSWIGFGWPDGRFFGAQKIGEIGINMVELYPGPDGWSRRTDRYEAEPEDIIFKEREILPGDYGTLRQPWYRRAVEADQPVWSEIVEMPASLRPAIANATPLYVHREFVGVIAVVIELNRLSLYLASQQVGDSGAVFIVDGKGGLVATQKPSGAERERMEKLAATSEPLLRLGGQAIAAARLDLGKLAATVGLPSPRDGEGQGYFVNATPLGFDDWTIVTVIPEADFLADIERKTRLLLYGIVGFTLAMALLAIVLANALLAAPLRRIAGQLAHVESFRLDRIRRLPSAVRELDQLSAALVQMGRGLASFQKFLPTELVRTLVSQGIEAKPGGHHQPLTVMFTDLAGFTGLSERLGEGIVPILADYLGRMSREVAAAGGTVDKFIGDAVMAFWGAPLPDEAHALNACRAALACQRMLAELNAEYRAAGRQELGMRIGLNSGRILVGNIGSEERLNYTAIGDAVNVASRLEAVNKLYGTAILIGEATRLAAGPAIVTREVDRVAVYGRMEGIAIHELLGLADEMPDGAPAWARRYERALADYRARAWPAASEGFGEAVRLKGAGDAACRLFVARADAFARDPPPADWAGVSLLDSK